MSEIYLDHPRRVTALQPITRVPILKMAISIEIATVIEKVTFLWMAPVLGMVNILDIVGGYQLDPLAILFIYKLSWECHT